MSWLWAHVFWAKALGAWLGFAALAVACGALRVKLVQPLVGEGLAHVLGTLAVCTLFLWLMARFTAWLEVREISRLLALGAFWTVLTVAFELGFGHWVAGHSWERLLADYNVAAGRIWVLVPLVMLLGPLWAAWMAGWLRGE